MKCWYSNGQTGGLKIETKEQMASTRFMHKIYIQMRPEGRQYYKTQSYDIDCGGIFPLIYFADMEDISFLIRYARSIHSQPHDQKRD